MSSRAIERKQPSGNGKPEACPGTAIMRHTELETKRMKFFRPLRPLVYGWLLSFVGWGLVSLVLGINFIGDSGAPWTYAFHAGIRDQLPWAVLTPLIFRFATRHLI